jgi:uncharacterized SAM-binding protein YcdF (DUF218 family)
MDLSLFIAKKVFTTILYPVGTSLLLLLAGIAFWLVRPRSRAGLFMVSLGTLWLAAMSCPITGQVMLRSLEADAGQYASPEELRLKNVRYVVVLGGDLRAGDLTPTDRIACSSLVRVMEGVRLWRGIPGAKLVLSGGTYSPDVATSARGMAAVAAEQGVPVPSMILESQSVNTTDEARLLKPILGAEPFALVTSASHMKRALMNFRWYGMNPIPGPADFLTKVFAPGSNAVTPTASGMELSQKAIHEYLGIGALLTRRWMSF